ncbi:MAG: hypothetical protein Q8O13_11185 [Candidatus Omnitrophota bacterium]|nr:hypothetical protein [Candidatus Omnitrophota bacterium]
MMKLLYKIKDKNSQHTIEYCVIIALVALGIILMRNYVYRSIFAGMKMWEDEVADSLEDAIEPPPLRTITLRFRYYRTTAVRVDRYPYLDYTLELLDVPDCPYRTVDEFGVETLDYRTNGCIPAGGSCSHAPIYGVTPRCWEKRAGTRDLRGFQTVIQIDGRGCFKIPTNICGQPMPPPECRDC